MATQNYTAVTNNPTVSGDAIDNDIGSGYITNVSLQWGSSFTKISTLEGSFNVPSIVKGQASVASLVPPSGFSTPLTTLSNTSAVELCINGTSYSDTYYTGGRINTRDLGEGLKTLLVTKIFTIFGICPTA